MANQIDNTEDLLDVETITDRFEELESELDDLQTAIEDAENMDDLRHAENALECWNESEEGKEYKQLEELLAEIQGCGGDYQWRGEWYPQTLIRDSYFEDYMDDMIEECYEIPNLPDFMTVTYDYVALRMDYSECEIEGITYLMR